MLHLGRRGQLPAPHGLDWFDHGAVVNAARGVRVDQAASTVER